MHVHSHDHSHGHFHGSGNVLRWSLAATTIFVVVQAAAGWTAGSLALLSDAGHNLTDALALALAMFGVYLQRKPADESRTFGYRRGGVLAAFVNALMLVVLSGYLLYEAWHRLQHPNPVEEHVMIAVAAAGIVLNVGIMLGLKRHRGDLNIRAAWLHMLGDALGSVAIIIGAVFIHYTGWFAIDPLLSVLISGLIIWSSIEIIRESLNVLLEGLPRGLDLRTVTAALQEVPGVHDVHDVHIWTLGAHAHALSCHALIEDMPPSESDRILREMNSVLADRFHIHHTTIQFEHIRCAVSETGCSMNHHHEPTH